MAAGSVLTVTTVVRMQPVGSVYVIVAVPVAMPETTPVVVTMVAMAMLLLLHVPAVEVFVNVVVSPRQTEAEPPITAGSGSTVTTVVAVQPVGMV
jgi:hypothetical protein